MPDELITIKEALVSGRSVNPVTVRELLSWFDARRRGVAIVAKIREKLEELALVTDPDFEEPWIDGLIAFHLGGMVNAEGRAGNEAAAEEYPRAELVKADSGWEHREAGYRLSRLEAANKKVVSVRPDVSLHEVVTMMMMHDFSQIPVMIGEREIKDVVTWYQIATHNVLGKSGERASDFMVEATVIDDTASIFEAIQTVVSRDFILVRDRQRRISGIVTAADLSLQFRALSEPFLLLSEIETHVRNMIGRSFSAQELAEARAPGSTHEVQSVADLTFGEYVFLLQKQDNWNRLDVKIDRSAFCLQLERVRAIRNQVMHFDPDGLDNDDIETLQDFCSFLKRLEIIIK